MSTNHIAEALGISPGNLYYHFRNKEEIIYALMERLIATWAEVFALPTDRPPTLQDLERLVRGNFEALWRYRFFYREMIALMQRDPKLQAHYQAVKAEGFTNFRRLFEVFVAVGIFRPVSPAELTQVTELCWLIGDFWLPYVEIGSVSLAESEMQRGVDLMQFALHPFIVGDPHGLQDVKGLTTQGVGDG